MVEAVRVDEGDFVVAGGTLARLRTSSVEKQLAAARAARDEAAARRLIAEADVERLQRLLSRNAVSLREHEQAIADRDAITQSVARFAAEAARFEEQIERARVTAPFAGRITAVHVELGEWVGQGDTIVTLVDLSVVEVTVQVAERFIGAVTVGFPVEVGFDAVPNRGYAGIVTAVVPQAILEARTFPVLVRVDNPDGLIQSGMAARVSAQVGDPQPAILVPKDGLVRRGGTVFVYRVQPAEDAPISPADRTATGPAANGDRGSGADTSASVGTVEQLDVETGPARGEWQVVYGALAHGDQVIVRGNERLFPGQPVRIVRELPYQPPGAEPGRPIAVSPSPGGVR